MGVFDILSSYLFGGSGFFVLFICPVICLSIILLACKSYNFSIIPEDLQNRKKIIPFKFPTVSRHKQGNIYKWDVQQQNDKIEDTMSDSSDSLYSSEDGFVNMYD